MSDCDHKSFRHCWTGFDKYSYRIKPGDPNVTQFKTITEYFCVCGSKVEEKETQDWTDS